MRNRSGREGELTAAKVMLRDAYETCLNSLDQSQRTPSNPHWLPTLIPDTLGAKVQVLRLWSIKYYPAAPPPTHQLPRHRLSVPQQPHPHSRSYTCSTQKQPPPVQHTTSLLRCFVSRGGMPGCRIFFSGVGAGLEGEGRRSLRGW